MNKNKFNKVIEQQVLDKVIHDPDYFNEVATEVKPSRIDSRRVKEQQHEMKKARRRNFDHYND
jgi:hypothetical protein